MISGTIFNSNISVCLHLRKTMSTARTNSGTKFRLMITLREVFIRQLILLGRASDHYDAHLCILQAEKELPDNKVIATELAKSEQPKKNTNKMMPFVIEMKVCRPSIACCVAC